MSATAPTVERRRARNYLNASYTIASWLTTTDHKRIGIMYLISITALFFIGGAAATVTRGKQRRCILGAQFYLSNLKVWPPCRFDVVAIDGEDVTWLPAAFDAS